MSRYLFHPKALPVSNIFEDWKTEMRRKNIHAVERQAVSPAAPFNPKLFKTGMLVIFDCFIAAFDLYWILRIFL